MKKIVINISDSTHEKLRFESISERKSIPDIINDRLFHKPFSAEVIESFDIWMTQNIKKMIED